MAGPPGHVLPWRVMLFSSVFPEGTLALVSPRWPWPWLASRQPSIPTGEEGRPLGPDRGLRGWVPEEGPKFWTAENSKPVGRHGSWTVGFARTGGISYAVSSVCLHPGLRLSLGLIANLPL